MKKYRVMIVDDQPIYRRGIIQTLNANQVVREIYEASSGERAMKLMDKIQIDIIFYYYVAGIDSYEVVKNILVKNRNSKIIVISNVDSVAVILNFFKIGVKGFLHKTMDTTHLLNAMRTVALNDFFYYTRFDEEVNWWLKIGLDGKLPSIRMSDREMQVIGEIARGKTSKEIAMILRLDIRTIETYRYDLLQKCGVRNTAEMLTYLYVNAII